MVVVLSVEFLRGRRRGRRRRLEEGKRGLGFGGGLLLLKRVRWWPVDGEKRWRGGRSLLLA
jgi:hypothetical protein